MAFQEGRIMDKQPITFTIDINAFDLSLLPIEPELLQNDQALLNSAISQYFAEYFNRIGGQADIVQSENILTVTWSPSSMDDYGNAVQEVIRLLKQGAYSTAEPIIKGMLTRFPDDPALLFNYGMVLSDQGLLKDAIDMLGKAVKSDPDNANAWNALGVAQSRAGDNEKSIFSLKKSYELDSGNGYTARNLGALIAKKSAEQALPYLKKASQLLPEDQQAQYGMAFCLLQLGKPNDADPYFKKAIEIDPYNDLSQLCREERTKIAQTSMRSASQGDERPDAVMYCLAALNKFKEVDPAQRQTITFEIAMLGQSGLDINNPTKKYQLKSMPGDFTGMQLLSYMYVGLKQMEPGIDTGIDLEKEYQVALNIFQNGEPK
jgi:tetratricopeptide (TPR) repeat protein